MSLSPRMLPAFLLLFSFWVSDSASAQVKAQTSSVEGAVVKIFSTLRNPDPVKPWTKQEPIEVTGSGVILDGKRILTNAHVILYASQVQVQAHGTGDKVPATVEAIAPGIDLALLKLDDDSFFEQRKPLIQSKTLPEVKDEVMVYGYPTGGSNLSITKGIISRIEFTRYNHPVSGLRIQVDAAINPGNSGGPAVVNGKMVGLVFSQLGGTQGIGYIIPKEEIDLFLEDVAHGRADAKPALFDGLATLENPALRAFLKLDKSVQGLVVHEVYGKGNPLQVWDIITHIGDRPVDDQGMIKLDSNLRIHFTYLVQHTAKNGNVPLKVVRAGKALELQVPASSNRPVMVPDLKGTYPPYFVCGPLVFSTASYQFFNTGGRMSNPVSMLTSPLFKRLFDGPAFPGEELVVISSPFLPSKLARGYSNPQGNVVKTINGIAIQNLRHLVTVLRDATDEFIILDFFNHECEALVFPRKELLEATNDLLSENGIRSQGSPELMKVWNEKKGQ